MKTWIVLAAIFCSVWVHASPYEEKMKASMLAMGKPLQPIDVQLLSGKPVSMSSLNGHDSVIYFFASWCAPCYSSLENMEAVRKEHKLSVKLVAMALDDDTEAVSNMIEKTGYTGEVWQAVSGMEPLLNRQFANKVKALPYLIKVNAKGELVEHNYNIKSVAQWRRVLVDNLPLKEAVITSE